MQYPTPTDPTPEAWLIIFLWLLLFIHLYFEKPEEKLRYKDLNKEDK